VIIFCSVRFLLKKYPNRNFFLKKTETDSNWFDSVLAWIFPVWLGFFSLARFWLGFFLAFIGLGSIWFFQFQAYKTETESNQSTFLKFESV